MSAINSPLSPLSRENTTIDINGNGKFVPGDVVCYLECYTRTVNTPTRKKETRGKLNQPYSIMHQLHLLHPPLS